MGITTQPGTRSHNRSLAYAGLLVVGLVALTALIGVLRRPVEYPAGSPQAVVQAYVRAIIDGDEDAAAVLLARSVDCDAADLADADLPDDVRVTLRSAEVDGDSAEVDVTVTVISGHGPFDMYEYDDRHRFELVRTGDRWLITRRPWPWTSCGR